MRVAVVVEGMTEWDTCQSPWIFHRAAIDAAGIEICSINSANMDWNEKYDAMLLHIWLDWDNPSRFNPLKILPVFAKYSEYRSRFPETIQIICSHTDMVERPYAIPYWRIGDPVLYRIPPYDRSKIKPFPAEDIWPWELVYRNSYGRKSFSTGNEEIPAAFIGTPTGPKNYRSRVAEFTNLVGVGICSKETIPIEKFDAIMSSAKIIVCPRGWGQSSSRHWDCWRSGKVVLTDEDCDAVEMVPGHRLRAGEHYLVFKDAADIPDIVSDWTNKTRKDDLDGIAKRAQNLIENFDGELWIKSFFVKLAQRL